MPAFFWIIAVLAAYLAGAIPFGLFIGRIVGGIDIRQHGSKNIGATNVGRVLGRRWGMLCFALDMLKGAVPVLIAGWLAGLLNVPIEQMTQTQMLLWLCVAMAAVVGHMYSIYLRFGGGKGVATGFGALLAMWPLLTVPVLGALVVWFAALRMTRYMALASMLGGVSVPIFLALWLMPPGARDIAAALTHAWPPLLFTSLLAVLVIYKHRTNIARMMKGEEPKIGSPAALKTSRPQNEPRP